MDQIPRRNRPPGRVETTTTSNPRFACGRLHFTRTAEEKMVTTWKTGSTQKKNSSEKKCAPQPLDDHTAVQKLPAPHLGAFFMEKMEMCNLSEALLQPGSSQRLRCFAMQP